MSRPPSPAMLLVMAFAVLLGVIMLKMTNASKIPRDHKMAMSRDYEDVSIVVLGDSTEAVAIDSFVMSLKCINLSVGGSGYSTWAPIFESIHDKAPKGELLLISADPMSLLRDGMGPRGKDCSDLIKRGAKLSNIPNLSAAAKVENYVRNRSWAGLVFGNSKLSMSDFLDTFRRSGHLPRINPYNHTPYEGKRKKQGYLHMFQCNHHVEDNMIALRKILAWAVKSDWQVVFVRTPVTEEFYEEDRDVWEKWSVDIIDAAREIVPSEKMKILDFKQDNRFSYQHFGDPNHLNAAGRKLFSSLLSGELAHMCNR